MSKLSDPLSTPLSPKTEQIYNDLVSNRGYIYEIYRALLNYPELAKLIGDLGSFLRFGSGTLPGNVRELLILFIARKTGAAYEWVMHEKQALVEGIPQKVVEAIRRGYDPQGLDHLQTLSLSAVRSVLEHKSIPQYIQDDIIKESGIKGIVEIVVLCGFYQMLASVIFAFDIPLPDGKAYPF